MDQQQAPDWRRKISDHIAYALLVYTLLQIFLTMATLQLSAGSLLPCLALVVLVAAIIPACRRMERRWTGLSDHEATDPARAPAFRRDRARVWAAAFALPPLLTGLFLLAARLLA